MKKIFLITVLIFMLVVPYVFADRNTSSFSVASADALIKRGDWKIYRISFVATANGGDFAIYDELLPLTESKIKTEGSEAVSLDSQILDFTGKPLEGSTGLYLEINDGTIVIEYE